MALEVRTIRDARAAAGARLMADRRLYLTADRATVVEEGDPRADSLFAAIGDEIAAADADRLGLTVLDGRIVISPRIAESPESVTKARPAPPNKQRRKGEDK